MNLLISQTSGQISRRSGRDVQRRHSRGDGGVELFDALAQYGPRVMSGLIPVRLIIDVWQQDGRALP
jgi:hypothetical protein